MFGHVARSLDLILASWRDFEQLHFPKGALIKKFAQRTRLERLDKALRRVGWYRAQMVKLDSLDGRLFIVISHLVILNRRAPSSDGLDKDGCPRALLVLVLHGKLCIFCNRNFHGRRTRLDRLTKLANPRLVLRFLLLLFLLLAVAFLVAFFFLLLFTLGAKQARTVGSGQLDAA